MGNYKVSIIVPVFNGSNYLEDAILSALSQSYDNIEILIVNDGSSDGGLTESICKKLSGLNSSKIRYYFKKNGGTASALNYGISKSKGDYIIWLSHDDLMHPKTVEYHLINLESNYAISCCGTKTFKTKIDLNKVNLPFRKGIKLKDILDFWRVWIYGCSLMIPKKILIQIGGLNEKNKISHDTELILKLLINHGLIYFPCSLVYRREHEDQGSLKEGALHEMESMGLEILKSLIEGSAIKLSGRTKLKIIRSENHFYAKLAFLYQSTGDLSIRSEFLLKEGSKKSFYVLNACGLFLKYPKLFKTFALSHNLLFKIQSRLYYYGKI